MEHPTRSAQGVSQKQERLRTGTSRPGSSESLGHEASARIANGVAHHVNNLLTVILGNLDMLSADCRADAADAARLERIRCAVEQGARLTDKLLVLSRGHALEREAVGLAEAVRESLHLLGHRFVAPVQLETRFADDLPRVLADRTPFTQVVVNLLLNALEALPSGGTVRITTRRAWSEDLARLSEYPPTVAFVVLEVEDDGLGMSSTTLDRAFEPFFTTKDPAVWAGLGLAVVHGLVVHSGGHVFLDSEPGRGTKVTLLLPEAGTPGGRSAGA